MMKEKEPSEAENALASLDIESLVAPAPTRSKFLESRHIFEDHPVFIQILQMDKAYFVWVGTIAPVFEHAHFSVPSKLVRIFADFGPCYHIGRYHRPNFRLNIRKEKRLQRQ